MSGNAIHPVSGRLNISTMSSRVAQLNEKATRLKAVRDRIAQDLASKEQEVKKLDNETEVLEKVVELFRVLMDQLVDKQVRVVEKVATKGLQTVFPDLNLSLESEVVPKYNKIAVEFYLRKGAKSNPLSYRGRPLDAFGGGATSFVSLVLRVLAVKKLKLWPILILDESLAAVSDEYIDLTGQFISSLAQKMGFDILLVTHKTSFLEHAKLGYRCSEELDSDGVSTHLNLKRSS